LRELEFQKETTDSEKPQIVYWKGVLE